MMSLVRGFGPRTSRWTVPVCDRRGGGSAGVHWFQFDPLSGEICVWPERKGEDVTEDALWLLRKKEILSEGDSAEDAEITDVIDVPV